MKKKLLIAVSIALGIILIFNGIVLAKVGIDGYQAYIQALEYGLKGLTAYFSFIIDLFREVLS